MDRFVPTQSFLAHPLSVKVCDNKFPVMAYTRDFSSMPKSSIFSSTTMYSTSSLLGHCLGCIQGEHQQKKELVFSSNFIDRLLSASKALAATISLCPEGGASPMPPTFLVSAMQVHHLLLELPAKGHLQRGCWLWNRRQT